MSIYASRSIKSKWHKTQWLVQQPALRRYVPRTMLFTKKNLNVMLNTFSTVYFKPTGGSGGSNIIRIKRASKGYSSQLNRKTAYHADRMLLFKALSHHANSRSYLLQKGISLANTMGRPFDIRVMVQKTNEGKWVSTGLFAKIGLLGKVATNYNQGGKIGYFVPTLRAAGFTHSAAVQKEHELKRLGVDVGHNFDKHYRGFRELGLDVALDTQGSAWILEVNTRPQFYPLKQLKNRQLYRRMLKFGMQYGRRK